MRQKKKKNERTAGIPNGNHGQQDCEGRVKKKRPGGEPACTSPFHKWGGGREEKAAL